MNDQEIYCWYSQIVYWRLCQYFSPQFVNLGLNGTLVCSIVLFWPTIFHPEMYSVKSSCRCIQTQIWGLAGLYTPCTLFQRYITCHIYNPALWYEDIAILSLSYHHASMVLPVQNHHYWTPASLVQELDYRHLWAFLPRCVSFNSWLVTIPASRKKGYHAIGSRSRYNGRLFFVLA